MRYCCRGILTGTESWNGSFLFKLRDCFTFVHVEVNVARSKLYSRDSAWAGVFARSTRTSAQSAPLIVTEYRMLLAFFN